MFYAFDANLLLLYFVEMQLTVNVIYIFAVFKDFDELTIYL